MDDRHRSEKGAGVMPRFGLFTLAALALFVLLGIFHHDAAAPDPAAMLAARLRAEGHTISKPRRTLWDRPGFAFSVDDCPAPVEAERYRSAMAGAGSTASTAPRSTGCGCVTARRGCCTAGWSTRR
jgi:hypothetical protein